MTATALTAELKRQAAELGFPLVGACPAVSPPGVGRLREWLARGYAGQMTYIGARQQAYSHPQRVLEGARSLLMLGMPYRTAEPAAAREGQGRVARYAWGSVDYHDLIRSRLHTLADFLQKQVPGALTRGVVDTAPLPERAFAQLAGLGWIGKNTLLLNRQAGSYFFLAALLTDQVLEYDRPEAMDHCGSCTACLEACPTQAFPQPRVLDASRCVSYLTIELREAMPAELRTGVGNWLFGGPTTTRINEPRRAENAVSHGRTTVPRPVPQDAIVPAAPKRTPAERRYRLRESTGRISRGRTRRRSRRSRGGGAGGVRLGAWADRHDAGQASSRRAARRRG
jgi:epoxyqueuosine reductase